MTKTTNYQLNQWEKSDRILMDDFNADNQKIDTALAARNCRFYTTSYTGDGELTKTWTFPAKPILIVLTCPTQWLLAVINAREGHGWGQLGGNSVTGLPCTVDGNSVTWSAENNSHSWMGNNKDTQYGMFAILEAE